MGESVHVCGYVRCGRSFSTPVRLTDFSHQPSSETYFACPYCFSKVDEHDHSEGKLFHGVGYEVSSQDDTGSLKSGEDLKTSKAETTVNCSHKLGYLKKRPKDQPIPESCLTCPNILKCMV